MIIDILEHIDRLLPRAGNFVNLAHLGRTAALDQEIGHHVRMGNFLVRLLFQPVAKAAEAFLFAEERHGHIQVSRPHFSRNLFVNRFFEFL